MCCNCLGDIVWEQCKDLPCSDETRNEIEEDIEKICYKNIWRVWSAVEEAAQE